MMRHSGLFGETSYCSFLKPLCWRMSFPACGVDRVRSVAPRTRMTPIRPNSDNVFGPLMGLLVAPPTIKRMYLLLLASRICAIPKQTSEIDTRDGCQFPVLSYHERPAYNLVLCEMALQPRIWQTRKQIGKQTTEQDLSLFLTHTHSIPDVL